VSPDDSVPLVAVVAGLGAVGAAAAAALRRRASRGAAAPPPLEQVITERTVRRARMPAASEVVETPAERAPTGGR
jgi:hypothetical protein